MSDEAAKVTVPEMTEADINALRRQGFHIQQKEHPDWIAGVGHRLACLKCVHIEWARRHGATFKKVTNSIEDEIQRGTA